MTIKKANQYLREGKTKEALKEYQKIETSNPLYDQAQFNIALIEQNLDSIILKKGRQTTIGKVVSTSSNLLSSNSKPLVSVVMPVFNVAPYLDASIISVLNQTYKNIELIIVNDASTDNGLNIIKMFEQQDSRIRVIDLEFNTLGGAGIPSNIGVDNAKGEYVAYADSDDILDKYAVENMLQAALTNKADIVIADFCNFNDETRIIDIAYDKKYWKDLPVNTVFNPKEYSKVFRLSPVPWRKLYKRSFLENNNIRFPEGDYFYEDNPLHWFVLAEASKVILVDKVVAYHRMGREGQTMAAGAYKLSALLMHINTIKNHFEKERNIPLVYRKELLDFIDRTNWVVDRQTNEKQKNLLKKRYYQVANDTSFIDKTQMNVILEDKIAFTKRCEDYNGSYPDIDIAIVIPVFNCADLLPMLMEKIMNIGIKAEVFLIDDGSSDGSTEICKEYERLNSNVFCFTQSNKGAGAARNSVIPLITAKYTYFMDADDDINAKALSDAVSFAEKRKYDLVMFKYKISFFEKKEFLDLWDVDREIWSKLLLASSNNDRKVLACQLVNYPWNRIISTKLLHDENIFFGKTIVHNDVPYHWHSIATAKNIGVFNNYVCIHRKFDNREQLTNISDKRRLMVLEAYRHTNEVLRKSASYPLIFNYWKGFTIDLLKWASGRVPKEYWGYYNEKRKEIIYSLGEKT